MARAKMTEYRAKRLLLGETYPGAEAFGGQKPSFPPGSSFVVKVDQGIKKRFKQGLVRLDQSEAEVEAAMAEWQTRGFSRFLIEPFVTHESNEEQYLSLERVRDGVRVLFARDGGVDIEAHPEAVKRYVIRASSDISEIARDMEVPEAFLRGVYESFEKYFFGFLEINPLVVRGNDVYLLDAAAMVDSAGTFFVHGAWGEDDLIERATHAAEERVRALGKTTPASLRLTVLHPQGSLFFLLSGGGGSIVIADEAKLLGAEKEIGNYGEYSGGPSREETHLYTREVLSLLLGSPAPKKALIIAGGVANFTDIKKTFAGVIDALGEVAEKLRDQHVKIFIRRGGPNEEEGLLHMKSFLEKESLLGSIHGSEATITTAVDEAIDYIHA